MNLLNPSNPNNPQDFWGVQHNQIVSAVLTSTTGSQFSQIADPHLKQQAIVSAVQATGNSMFGYCEDPYTYFRVLPAYNGLLSQVDFSQPNAIIDCFPNQYPWLRDKLKDLFNLLYTMPLNTEGDVNQALNTILAYENQMIAQGFTDPALLATIAVGKYSLYGWFTLPNIPGGVQASINWGGVLSDAAGALAGGIILAAAASTVYKCCTS